MTIAANVLLRALNHLIAGEVWAQHQLVPHAGKIVRLCAPPLPEVWAIIEGSGTLAEVVPGEAAASVTLTVSPLSILKPLGTRDAVERAARFEGDPALEAALRDLLRSLRWDVEEDLSKWIGDAAAHRVTSTGRRAREWYSAGLARAGQNVGEYLSEERRVVVSQTQFADFKTEIDRCNQRLDALEQRIGKLEQGTSGSV